MRDWAAAVALVSPLGAIEGLPPLPDGTGAPNEAERTAALEAWTAEATQEGEPLPDLAFSMLGMFLHLHGQYEGAMLCYNHALELRPSAIDVLLKRSSLWFEKEQLPNAFADFDTALAIDDSHADIYCHRGQLYMLQQDLSKAVDDLTRSVELDPNSVRSQLRRPASTVLPPHAVPPSPTRGLSCHGRCSPGSSSAWRTTG